jgi:hypothetical protein
VLVQVREVDQDPEPVALGHETAAGPRQSVADVGRGGKVEGHALCERVRPAPDEADGAQPALVELREVPEVRLDRLGPLEMADRSERAAVQRRLDIGGRACQAHLAAPGELVEQVDHCSGFADGVIGRDRPRKRQSVRRLAIRNLGSGALLLGLR